jgi:DNA-binding CsgD family transcriptional regulator
MLIGCVMCHRPFPDTGPRCSLQAAAPVLGATAALESYAELALHASVAEPLVHGQLPFALGTKALLADRHRSPARRHGHRAVVHARAAHLAEVRPCAEREVGSVEVYYLRKKPESDEGPFLKEERALIDAVAERLGRTAEWLAAEEQLRVAHGQLQIERKALQESNSALRTVLARIEDEKSNIKQAVVANVEKILLPILHALEAEIGPDQKGYARLLRYNLEEIASPLVDRLSRRALALTPTEVKICSMIKMGLTTKEIARIRHVAPATVSRQRESIRKKLGLGGKSINLATFLQTFTSSIPRTDPRRNAAGG